MAEVNTFIVDWNLFWDNLEQEIAIKILRTFSHTKITPINPKINHKIIRKKRCGKCTECTKPKCGICINCRNKTKRKQRCKTIGLCTLWFLPE